MKMLNTVISISEGLEGLGLVFTYHKKFSPLFTLIEDFAYLLKIIPLFF